MYKVELRPFPFNGTSAIRRKTSEGHVSTQTLQSYTWLRKIPGELFALDEKPLLGFSPPFPWQEFSAEIGRSLKLAEFSISPGELRWRSSDELFAGMGDKLSGIPLVITPLAGSIWWVMSEKSVIRFMELLLIKDQQNPPECCADPDFIKAASQFLSIEAISAFQKMNFDKKLMPMVTEGPNLPTDSCLCQDLEVLFKGESLYGRLYISPAFRTEWTLRYLENKPALTALPMADSLDVVVHLEAGRIDLKPSEWKQLVIGDFVIIDTCSLDPDEDKGRVMLVINGIPCFRAKIKQGSLKILEHPLYHEVGKFMADLPPKGKHPEDDDFDDDNLDHGDTDDEDHSLSDHTDSDLPDHAESEDEEFDIDDSDLDLDDDEVDKKTSTASKVPEKKSSEAKPSPAVAPTVPKDVKPPEVPKKTNIPLSVDEIPLSVVIEVGRIQMSVKKLLELQPGNMLELDIHPESGVDMVVNGKRIARGELLRIGDVLGIRIMELS